MAANTTPIYTITPNVNGVKIVQTNAQVKSDGTSAASGADMMYKVFSAGTNGSYLEKIRFTPVAEAALATTPTTLRIYVSSIATPDLTPTTNANTFLLFETAASATITAASLTVASPYYEIVLNISIATGQYIHVSQAIAQANAVKWQAIAYGGDF